jgi:hypothetical protein
MKDHYRRQVQHLEALLARKLNEVMHTGRTRLWSLASCRYHTLAYNVIRLFEGLCLSLPLLKRAHNVERLQGCVTLESLCPIISPPVSTPHR